MDIYFELRSYIIVEIILRYNKQRYEGGFFVQALFSNSQAAEWL